jgi:hypothetical protein
MAALTANKVRYQRNLDHKRTLEITGTDSLEFYEGALCSWAAAASTVGPSSDTASERFAGVCSERVTTGASNTLKIKLEWGHSEWFPVAATSIAAGDEGKNAVIADDATLSEVADETNDVPAGMIEELETIDGTAGCWITVGIYAPTNA